MTDPMRPGEPTEGEYTDSELPEDARAALPDDRDHDAEAVSAERDTQALEIDVDENEGDVEIEEEGDEVDIVAPDAIIPPTRGFPL